MRLATLDDLGVIMDALIKMLSYSPAPQMKYASTTTATLYVAKAIRESRVDILGDYMVMYDVITPWFSTTPMLAEEIIIKVWNLGHRATVQDCVKHLETRAKQLKCVCVIAGDTQVGYMEKHYLDAGFVVLGKQFYKEL